MNPYQQAALFLIRLVASGFMLFGFIYLGLYLFKSFLAKSEVQIGSCLLPAIPIVIGLVILIKSSAIANRLTRNFDE